MDHVRVTDRMSDLPVTDFNEIFPTDKETEEKRKYKARRNLYGITEALKCFHEIMELDKISDDKNGDSNHRDDMKIDNQPKALKNKLLTREEIRDATITMKDSSKIDNNITRTPLRSIAGKDTDASVARQILGEGKELCEGKNGSQWQQFVAGDQKPIDIVI